MRIAPHTLALVGLLLNAPAAGQKLPGYSGDYDTAESQYRAYALDGFQTVFNEWMAAVQSRNVERALRLYSDDVFLHLGEPANGTANVEAVLGRWLESLDGIRTGLRDFDASGKLAYGTLHVVVNARNPDEDGTGIMVFVMKRAGSGWKIRSQTLLLD